ncbi:SGT1-domain-containing protein, partial [Coccomyxa subellipsoidea C-169]
SLPCLWGCVHFGDNLEDEWFITWLLQQLTLRIPGSTARVWDNDGEFLLIEAAYSLPRWLKPETSTNRVWIAGGKLHIVPLPSAAAPSIPSFPTLTQALQLVRSEHAQAAIQARLGDFQPGRHKHMHRARTVVPARVAAVLAAEPQLIAPAVEAFHYRDLDDMKAAARMQHFPPQASPYLYLECQCLYAQLEQQQFEPPKGYALPAPESATFRAAQLGMKLTCGFEMLYSRREHHADPDNGKQKVADNPSWRVYKSSLERNGYFKGNIPGSQQHRELMQAALQSFVASEAYKKSCAALAAPVLRMQDILQHPPSRDQLEKGMQGAEDEDSWMRDGADVLERELAARQTEREASASGKPLRTDFDPEDMAERVKAFVAKESSFEGAELPAAASREGVSFDGKRFLTELGAALGMQPGDADPFLQDLASDSEDEGSSFFGGASEDADVSSNDDDDASAEPDAPNVYRAQRAERSHNGRVLPESGQPSNSAEAAAQRSMDSSSRAACEDVEEEEEELRPVDIDLNLVQNLLASYSGQQGLPGPVSNLMGLMGLHLPDD